MEMREDVVTPHKQFHEYVGMDRFFKMGPENTKYATRYHEFAREATETFNTINNYMNMGDLEDAKAMAADNPDFKARKKFAARISKQLSSVRKQEKLIWSNLVMSRQQKKAKLDRLKERKNEIYRNAYKAIKKFE